MPEPLPRRSHRVPLPGSSSASSAFPQSRLGRLPASSRERDFAPTSFRGCSYSIMFRPPSLLASQIAPTAASFLAEQLRRLNPSRACVVTFTRIGYATRPTTGNWRREDFHLARFTALSTAPYSATSSNNTWCNTRPGVSLKASNFAHPADCALLYSGERPA